MFSLLIIGPPNSGKSWFMLAIGDAALTAYRAPTLSANNAFPFQEFGSKRLIIFDEAAFADSFCDSLKKLLSGE